MHLCSGKLELKKFQLLVNRVTVQHSSLCFVVDIAACYALIYIIFDNFLDVPYFCKKVLFGARGSYRTRYFNNNNYYYYLCVDVQMKLEKSYVPYCIHLHETLLYTFHFIQRRPLCYIGL